MCMVLLGGFVFPLYVLKLLLKNSLNTGHYVSQMRPIYLTTDGLISLEGVGCGQSMI